MAINLLAIQPHKVSRDLSGYITYIYGAAKVGKTTLCSKFPKTLILAFEKGYNTLPGVMVQDITRWSEFKEVIRELKKPEVKEAYSTIVVDTVDVAGSYCEKYICNQLGIENLGDGGWENNGWSKYKKELEDCFRTITHLGYSLVCISHDQDKEFKRKDGTKFNQVVPTAQKSLNNIVRDMADLYVYAAIDEHTKQRKLVFRSLDGTVDCGSRFKYMPVETELSYDALVKAVNEAIEKEAVENDNKFVTDEKIVQTSEKPDYDYFELMNEFNNLVQKLMSENQTNAMKITTIVDKYLGKGKKVSDSTPAQVDLIHLIVEEIKSDLIK